MCTSSREWLLCGLSFLAKTTIGILIFLMHSIECEILHNGQRGVLGDEASSNFMCLEIVIKVRRH